MKKPLIAWCAKTHGGRLLLETMSHYRYIAESRAKGRRGDSEIGVCSKGWRIVKVEIKEVEKWTQTKD